VRLRQADGGGMRLQRQLQRGGRQGEGQLLEGGQGEVRQRQALFRRQAQAGGGLRPVGDQDAGRQLGGVAAQAVQQHPRLRQARTGGDQQNCDQAVPP